jgi:hypothetical protein
VENALKMKSSELFELILERPALYIGHPSVPLAFAFIDGHAFGNGAASDDLYSGFNMWVAKRFRITTAHNWASIVCFMGGSEAGAFKLAKELWGEYKFERAKLG